MKKFAKLMALLLALVLVLSLVACKKADNKTNQVAAPGGTNAQNGDNDISTPPVQEATVEGKWAYTMDAERLISIAAEQEGASDEELDMVRQLIGDTEIRMYLELNADGTLRFAMDPESAQAMAENMVQNLPQLMAAMYGVSMEELESMLAEQGMTMEQFTDMMRDEINPEDMMSDIEDVNGIYKVEGDKLYVANEGDEFDENNYLVFTLSGNTLIVTDIVGVEGEDSAEAMKQMLPLTFTRVN